MTEKKNRRTQIWETAGDYISRFRERVRERLDERDPVQIVAYMGYGTGDYLYIKGRVLEHKDVESVQEDNRWRNLVKTYRRFDTEGIAACKVRVNYYGQTMELTTNEEGYFCFDGNIETIKKKTDIWQALEAYLLEAPIEVETPLETEGAILIPDAAAQIGVISDLDDTVIQTNVTSTMKMLYNTFFKNAHTRRALQGVPAFYRALHKGQDNQQANPLFYVSHSPWNLYDMLEDFMEINRIPYGPILLRDFSARQGEAIVDYKTHKYDSVVRIMRTYPQLSFILIGDSAEKDVDIYREVARAFPGRVAAIYIRSVQHKRKDERVQKIADREDNVEIVLVKDSLEAAKHAASKGLISLSGLKEVEAEVSWEI